MVKFDFRSEEILKNPVNIINKFSIELFKKREEINEKLKSTSVMVKIKEDEHKKCTFLNSDNTHFTYKLEGDTKIRKASLTKLVFNKQ